MKQAAILMPSLRGGGVEKVSLILAEELIKRGVDLDLVVINTINSAYTPNPNINLIDLKTKQIRYALPALVKYLRTARPEIMFSAETPVNSLALVGKIITGYPKRIVVSEHNHLSSVTRHATRLGDHIRPLLVKYLYPRADLIVPVSNGIANDLIASYKVNKNKVRTIYNMFDIKAIISSSQAKTEHPWLDKYAPPLIINAGRLSPQKDQATLIKAFAILRTRMACRLLILGEGTERSNLLELAQKLNVADDMLMPGFVSNPFAFVAQARVFVLSSAWEGLPTALIEALACGTPVVSTDCPSGPAEILEDGKFGPLTPVGDEHALAEAILKTLEHPLPAAILRQRALDFSIENIIPKYLEIFQSASFPTSGLL